MLLGKLFFDEWLWKVTLLICLPHKTPGYLKQIVSMWEVDKLIFTN